MEPFPAPPPKILEKDIDIDAYVCSKCSSNIEIESFDDKNSKITFKCLNKNEQNNHHIQYI